MTSKKYSHFSIEDFASDTYFQNWILEDDHMTNLFWKKWLLDNPNKKEDIELAKKIITQLTFKEYQASSEEFNEVWKNIKENQENWTNPTNPSKIRRYVGVAATLAILISSSFFANKYYFNISKSNIETVSTKIVNTIVPGTDKATLTLGDGSEIVLKKGIAFQTKNANSNGKKIIYKAENVNKKAEVAYNYLTIPRGGQFFIELSDGTKVWLNSESQLKYPVSFIAGVTRQVELVYGEAYFDVSPSTMHNGSKFKVVNQAQELEVLGTEFNIKAYKDEQNVYTTLVEGKVEINASSVKLLLVPNEQSNLNKLSNKMSVSVVDVNTEISWKTGVFRFKGKRLIDIMKVISRWYDVEVVFENKELESLKFKGVLEKEQSIEEILSIMKSSTITDYEIKDKVITLK